MPEDCLFCKIGQGAIPSHRVYEDASTLAFLDIHPLAKGHTLVIPKQHAARFEDLTPDQVAGLWKAVHRVTSALTKTVGAAATTLAVNNGKEAGQEVPHVHVHVVPRAAGDGVGPVHALAWPRPALSKEDLEQLAGQVRKALPAPGRPAPV